MDGTLELAAINPENCWIAIDTETGAIVSEGKTPAEASENVEFWDRIILSFVTNDSKSYIF